MKTKEFAISLANNVCERINNTPLKHISSNTPYKRQDVLEYLISELKERV